MTIKYRYAESTSEPESIMYGKSTVYLRQNIAPTTRMDDEENEYTVWTYEEAKLSYSEFKEYSEKVSAMNALNSVEIPTNVKQILEGQSNGDNNQLIIMEAIAELYELIANLS